MGFQNAYISASRLSTIEECLRKFEQRYVLGIRAGMGLSIPAEFGKVQHGTLERSVDEHARAGVVGPLNPERAREIYRDVWAESPLTGVDLYDEGLGLIESFVARTGLLDPATIVAVEHKFEFKLGRFTVVGVIDRVDRLDHETVRIVDYKSNRLVPSRDELDAHLQLSIYAMAAGHLFPWAKRVVLSLDMLRHGKVLTTHRTKRQLDVVADYVQALAERSETSEQYPPTLAKYCAYCDYRADCPAYLQALEGGSAYVCDDLRDLQQVAREREQLVHVSKIVKNRKDQLDGAIKSHLENTDELRAAGMRYTVFKTETKKYALLPTAERLAAASGMDRDEVIGKIATVEKKRLDALLKGAVKSAVGQSRSMILKAEIDASAKKTYSSRLWAKEFKVA